MSYPTLFATPGMRAIAEQIDAERQVQLTKWGVQLHPVIDPRDIPEATHPYYASRADIWRKVNEERAAAGPVAAHAGRGGGARMIRTRYDAPDTVAHADQWRSQAACLGQWEAMHPDNNEHEIAHAKAICGRCPVRVACFWDAVRTGDNQYGIRAGLRANERRDLLKKVRRQQRKQAAA